MKLPNLQNTDKTLWAIYISMIVVAIIALFSASSMLVYKDNSVLGPVGEQILFIVAGVVLAFLIQFLPSYIIRIGGYALLLLSVILVWSLLVPHNPFAVAANGATRWVCILGITFQPSELAKLSLIIVVADLLSRIKTEADKRKYFFWTLGITVVVALPVMTSNLSTAILICGIVFLLWILARIPFKFWGSTAGIAIIFLVLGYCIVEFGFVRQDREMKGLFGRAETWVSRIDRKFAGTSDDKTAPFVITDENRQEAYANVAIARGGKSPFGVLPGNSKERDYLPLAFADYIYAIIVEESGIVGALVVIALYLWLLFRACFISTRYGDYAAMLMVMGLALMLTCQALISMLVAVGLGPVTGQPLPLISRGGTSVLITSVYFGIMMSVSREQTELRNPQQESIHASQDEVPDIKVE